MEISIEWLDLLILVSSVGAFTRRNHAGRLPSSGPAQDPPSPWRPRAVVFSEGEQAMSAGLLRVLLLRAGIESNPGPATNIWPCSSCGNNITRKQGSLSCNKCSGWIHLKCSGIKQAQWTTNYIGPCCSNGSTFTPKSSSTPTPTPSGAFGVVQININGLRGKIDSVVDFMVGNGTSIAAIQETHLRPNTTLRIPSGFSIVRKDRPCNRGKGGGLAFIIKESVFHRVLSLPTPPGDEHLEQQAIEVRLGNSGINIINFYCPPASSCSQGYVLTISHLLNIKDTIIMGDVNAHHQLWHSALTSDTRGDKIAGEIENSCFAAINEDVPTRVTNTSSSSPDITLVEEALIMGATWTTVAALGSDHLPILVTIQCEVGFTAATRRQYINFKKADWEGFTTTSESSFSTMSPPRNVFDGERRFRRTLVKAAKLNIPAGCIREIRPYFPREAISLAKERDLLQAQHPGHSRLPLLNAEINDVVTAHRREKWRGTSGGDQPGEGQRTPMDYGQAAKRQSHGAQQPASDFQRPADVECKKVRQAL